MTDQLSLHLEPTLPYSRESFVVHNGISGILQHGEALVEQDHFRSAFIVGEVRSGKTHTACVFAESFSDKGHSPLLLDGLDLETFMADFLAERSPEKKDVILIDDADRYFQGIQPGMSGPFVGFYEALRQAEAKLFLFSQATTDIFPCDDHILSRLRAAEQYLIGAPEESVLPELIEKMARQRGIDLSGSKINYLQKRIGRNPAEIEKYLERADFLSQFLGKSVNLRVLSKAL